jgi:hypothetical protein
VVNQLKVKECTLKLTTQNTAAHTAKDTIVKTQDHVGKLTIGLVKHGNK